jgi:hypothetical protein
MNATTGCYFAIIALLAHYGVKKKALNYNYLFLLENKILILAKVLMVAL